MRESLINLSTKSGSLRFVRGPLGVHTPSRISLSEEESEYRESVPLFGLQTAAAARATAERMDSTAELKPLCRALKKRRLGAQTHQTDPNTPQTAQSRRTLSETTRTFSKKRGKKARGRERRVAFERRLVFDLFIF